MSIYLCFLVPVLLGVILVVFFRHKIVWWELVIPFIYTVVFVLIAKYIAVSSLTYDTEYLGGYVTEVRYYEDWNEYIHRMCSYKCGKTTCWRDCSYVKYHPEYWEAETTLGTFTISEQRYNQLRKKFNSETRFVDMHRHYHTNDGDMYSTFWRGDDEGLEPVTVEEHYENKPKASLNVFHFGQVDSTDYNRFKPVDYPVIHDLWNQDCILGYSDPAAERQLEILNARLGGVHHMRAYIVIFKNQPREAGIVQERYWEGGNKNEIVICIGVDDANNVQWGYDFSWTERQDYKIEIRNFAEGQKKLDLSSVVSFLDTETKTKWKIRDFKEFDYLTIEPTISQVIWILILTFITNGLVGWWIVVNDFEAEYHSSKKRRKNEGYYWSLPSRF